MTHISRRKLMVTGLTATALGLTRLPAMAQEATPAVGTPAATPTSMGVTAPVSGRSMGNPDATVTVIEWGNYQ